MKKILIAGVAAAVLTLGFVSVSANDKELPTKQTEIVKPNGDPGGVG